MKDRYIEGILTAYNRVLALIDALDPNSENDYLQAVKGQIKAAIFGYTQIIEAIEGVDQSVKVQESQNNSTVEIDDAISEELLEEIRKRNIC